MEQHQELVTSTFLGRTFNSATCMAAEEELACLKAHLINLPPAVLRQPKREIVLEKKRRGAATAAKAPGPGEGPTGLGGGRQPSPAGEKSAPPQKARKQAQSQRAGLVQL